MSETAFKTEFEIGYDAERARIETVWVQLEPAARKWEQAYSELANGAIRLDWYLNQPDLRRRMSKAMSDATAAGSSYPSRLAQMTLACLPRESADDATIQSLKGPLAKLVEALLRRFPVESYPKEPPSVEAIRADIVTAGGVFALIRWLRHEKGKDAAANKRDRANRFAQEAAAFAAEAEARARQADAAATATATASAGAAGDHSAPPPRSEIGPEDIYDALLDNGSPYQPGDPLPRAIYATDDDRRLVRISDADREEILAALLMRRGY